MSVREATAVITNQGLIYAYPPVYGMQPVPATITTPGVNYSFTQKEARVLAQIIAPDLAPEQVKEDLLKPYQDKAAAALKEMTETVESWTRELIAARQSQWEGHQLADSMENLLAALAEPLVALREIKDGDL